MMYDNTKIFDRWGLKLSLLCKAFIP
jgi:hypothetical protein